MHEDREQCDAAQAKLKRIEEQLVKLPLIFQKVVQGDFSEQPELLDGDDEIARLILAFRFMMEDLQRGRKEHADREQILEREVARKTLEIRENQQRLVTAQALAHIGNWEWDVLRDAVIWSDEFYKIFGLDRQAFVPTFRGFLDLVHPEDRERVQNEIQRALKNKERAVFDHRIVRPDGSERILHAIAEVDLDDNREVKRMHGTGSDITELKLQEYSLKEERDRVKAILGSVGEGLIVVDQYSQIMLINQTAQKELRITVGEAIGIDVRTLITVFDKKGKLSETENPFNRALATAKVFTADLSSDYYFECGAVRFPVSLVVTPLRGDTGIDTFGLVVVFRNITDEKKFDDAKVNFISVASHQLRTPLTPMRWFAEMLLNGDVGELKPDQKQLIEDIYKNIDRMVSLINLLLQIARVESGRVSVKPKLISLVDLSGEVVGSLKTLLAEKSHTVTVKSEPKDFPLVAMDKEIVWQVIQNLLTNAVRYSPPSRAIEISAVVKGEIIEYSVRDYGIGIPKDEQHNIFQKFFRAKNAFRMAPEGTGLGLSLVNSLVTDWGGKTWFETKENEGTTFFFTMPLHGVTAREGEVTLAV